MATGIKTFYKGFSTRRYEGSGGSFELYNVECIEEDLANEIFTIKGERLMMPDFGTRIPLLVFEPNDLQTQTIIREDLEAVFGRDPRIELLNLDVVPSHDNNAIVAIAKIRYIEFNITKDLNIEISSR